MSPNPVITFTLLACCVCPVISAPVPADGEHKLVDLLPAGYAIDASEYHSFSEAFSTSVIMILATETGDKTFFLAAIMSMKHSRLQVLLGALSALSLMTVLSAFVGKAFPVFLDVRWTSLAAASLFAYFGLRLLVEVWKQRGKSDCESSELHEAEESLQENLFAPSKDRVSAAKVDSFSVSNCLSVFAERASTALSRSILPDTFVHAFVLTFLAEWGDRSQIATIALAAAKDVLGVTLGALFGHTICTSVAVLGGRMLAARISERSVNLVGGTLFLLFAVATLIGSISMV